MSCLQEQSFSNINTYFILPSGFRPAAEQLSIFVISARRINVTWAPPSTTCDCYSLANYSVDCRRIGYTDTITNTTPASARYFTVSGLVPDSWYQCSVAVLLQDKGGNPATLLGLQPANISGYTLPEKPPRPPPPVSQSNTDHSITLDLSSAKSALNTARVSHLRIFVLRLGPTDTQPQGSPDQLYLANYEFATYQQVHSNSNTDSSSTYRPYPAAEFEAGQMPETFVIGGENVANRNSRSDSVNGPLAQSNFYTCFLRVYSSSNILRRQEIVYSSSVFLFPPVELTSTDTSIGYSDHVGLVPGVTVTVLFVAFVLTVILVIVGVVLIARLG